MRSKNTDMTGQMLVVLELMDLYPLRPESKLDFDGVVFNAFHAKAEPGEIFTIIDTRRGASEDNITRIAPSCVVEVMPYEEEEEP